MKVRYGIFFGEPQLSDWGCYKIYPKEFYPYAKIISMKDTEEQVNGPGEYDCEGNTKARQPVERFIKPTDRQIIGLAILFNDGKMEDQKIADMVAMCEYVIDRLYENGNILEPSSKEK